MKRILAMALVSCLLLCGCCCQTAQIPDAPVTTEDVTMHTAAVVATEPVTEMPTEAPTEAPTEPPQQELAGVYLLDEVHMVDNGPTKYTYDSEHNLVSYKSYTIENNLRYTAYFEQRDVNGMAGQLREVWGDNYEQNRILVWDENGMLYEEQYEPGFSGYQYDYDEDGRLIAKREYYEGLLVSTVYYSYTNDYLTDVYCEDVEGAILFDCLVENGRIIEKRYYDEDGDYDYSYTYKYDANGLLTATYLVEDGESMLCETYTYRGVAVEYSRVKYLESQQKYLLAIA